MEPEVPTPFSVLSESTPGMTDYSSVAGSLPPTPAFVESYVAQSRYGPTRMVSSFKDPVPAHLMWSLDDLIFSTVLGSVVEDDILGMLARDTLPTAPPTTPPTTISKTLPQLFHTTTA
ncbi:hypothetical protein PNOK_0854100 [Pyrrhoderma noxium]|uniref:Uncharacterized protein n=1 Tax=Pyrrhoderma noxium TaxID=2282107 RepID=A0A286U7V8_9AGAM|nr:hypothetical protein PNOK_0854100 [Pyrrhoderma noxium]